MKRKLRVFALLGLLVMVVPIARGLVRSSASIPEPRYDEEWEATFQDQRSQVMADEYQLVFVGDSITEFWAREGRESWDHYYGNRKALNFGIGGDRTENVLWRLENSGLDRLAPKVAVVMIGVNNFPVNDAYSISEGIESIVRNLQVTWPDAQILVLSVLPAAWYPEPHFTTMSRINRRAAFLADDTNVHFFDLTPSFVDDHDLVLPGLMIDNLHLSAEGYRVWAETMEPLLSRLLGDAVRRAQVSIPTENRA